MNELNDLTDGEHARICGRLEKCGKGCEMSQDLNRIYGLYLDQQKYIKRLEEENQNLMRYLKKSDISRWAKIIQKQLNNYEKGK